MRLYRLLLLSTFFLNTCVFEALAGDVEVAQVLEDGLDESSSEDLEKQSSGDTIPGNNASSTSSSSSLSERSNLDSYDAMRIDEPSGVDAMVRSRLTRTRSWMGEFSVLVQNFLFLSLISNS